MDALFGATCASTFLLTSYSTATPVLNCFCGYIGIREDFCVLVGENDEDRIYKD